MTALYGNGHVPNQTSLGWIPPTKSQFLRAGNPHYFRWCNGSITRLPSISSDKLQVYQAASIFCEAPTLPLLAISVDATRQDVGSNPSHPQWTRVQFRPCPQSGHSNQLYSYIDFVASELHTASPMPGHITPQLVPHQHNLQHGDNRRNAGLIGELTLLIGLAIFSAGPEFIASVLSTCITPGRWIPHQHRDGRSMTALSSPRQTLTALQSPDEEQLSPCISIRQTKPGPRTQFSIHLEMGREVLFTDHDKMPTAASGSILHVNASFPLCAGGQIYTKT